MSSHQSALPSGNTQNHFYRGSFQQSGMYNTLLPSQGTPLYNGMPPAQGFQIQNSYTSPGFNGYNYMDPTLWLPDTRPAVTCNNLSLLNIEKSGKSLYSNKNNVSNSSASVVCCNSVSTRPTAEKNVTYSHGSNESYKTSYKQMNNLSTKVSPVDSSSWYCGQGVMNYQNHNYSQASSYKYNEQFSSCSSQNFYSEQVDSKQQSTNVVSYFDHFQNQMVSSSKQSYYSSKAMCLEQEKECLKYLISQDLQANGMPMTEILNEKPRDQESRSSQSSMFGSSISEIHEEALYSQASLFFHENQNQLNSKNSFMTSKQDNSESDRNYNMYQQCSLPQVQHDNKYDMNSSSSCDITGPSLQSRPAPVVDNCTVEHTAMSQLLCSANDNGNILHCKDASSQDCGSDSTSESDIIVEETEEEIIGDEDLPENVVYSKKEDVEFQSDDRCIVCENNGFSSPLSKVTCKYPTTTSSNTPLMCKLLEVLSEDQNMPSRHSDFMCRRCLNLLNMIDCLETKLTSVKHEILQLFGKKVFSWKVSENILKTLDDAAVDNKKLDDSTQLPEVCKSDVEVQLNVIEVEDTDFIKTGNDIINNETTIVEENEQLQDGDTNNISLTDLTNDNISIIDIVNDSSTLSDATSKKFDLTEEKETVVKNVITEILDKIEVSDVGNTESVNSSFVKENTKLKGGNTETNEINNCVSFSKVIKQTEIFKKEEKKVNIKYQCTICSNHFSTKMYLEIHKQQHTKKFNFYCDKCGKGFTLSHTLDNHMLLHTGEYRFQCEICGKRFRHRYVLINHLCKHTEDYRFSCHQCGKGFTCNSALDIHIRSHNGFRPYICECCGKRFSSLSNLTVHVRICSGDLPFKCDYCEKCFATQAKVDIHFLAAHKGENNFTCTTCQKGFCKKSDLIVHMRSHTKEKPYKCNVCHKTFISKSNLNHHYKSHITDQENINNRLFKCEMCDKTFSRPSALLEHTNRHKGLKSFKCVLCEKSFATQRNLQAHKNWHEGNVKTYTCNICGKNVKHGLTVHMRSHSGEKPYKCEKCEMAFSVKSSLDKHRKRHVNDIR